MTVVFILHGLFGSARNWRSVSQELGRILKRTVTPLDLPLHGNNPRHGPAMTYDLVLKEMQRETSADYIGHSMAKQFFLGRSDCFDGCLEEKTEH